MTWFVPSLLFFLTGVFSSPQPSRFQFRGRAQGTTWHITYYATDSLVGRNRIDSVLSEVDASLSLYVPNSLVNRWNRSPKGVRPDRHLQMVVKHAIDVYNDTGGLFDITVYPLTSAWGFGPVKPDTLPGDQAIRRLLNCIGTGKIRLRKGSLTKKTPCVQLDPNGIAQGYTVDLLADLLEKNNIHDYLVELGGEIRVKGHKYPSKEKMTIGIEAPGDDPLMPVINRIISLDSGAVTTSGNYRRYSESGNTRVHHLLDPRTGYSIQNDLISVTVVAADAITADAYDNALMAMGMSAAYNFVEARPDMAAYFIYRAADGSIADTMTSRFAPLLIR